MLECKYVFILNKYIHFKFVTNSKIQTNLIFLVVKSEIQKKIEDPTLKLTKYLYFKLKLKFKQKKRKLNAIHASRSQF